MNLDQNVLDRKTLEELYDLVEEGETNFVDELIETFLSDAPRLLREIKTSLRDVDREQLSRSVHTLKSSSAVVGALSLSSQCKYLEGAVHQAPISELSEQIAVLHDLYISTETALRKEKS
jgi:HPt (histidine-containing phosphotransfer) domain-containing protein